MPSLPPLKECSTFSEALAATLPANAKMLNANMQPRNRPLKKFGANGIVFSCGEAGNIVTRALDFA